MLGLIVDFCICPDRNAGRVGGVNPDNGSGDDPKNLRVKVHIIYSRL